MELSNYLFYVTAILVLTASPGPSVLYCITQSITQGFSASVYSALGVMISIVGIMTLSFTGLGVIISSSELAFNIVKWVGAAYLIVIGVKLIFSDSTEMEISEKTEKAKYKFSKISQFLGGFLVGATNPKAIVFFTALFPQFIDMGKPLLTQYFILVSTFAVFELWWLTLYSYFGSKSSKWIMSDGRAKTFNRITGGVFIGAGVILSSTRVSAQ